MDLPEKEGFEEIFNEGTSALAKWISDLKLGPPKRTFNGACAVVAHDMVCSTSYIKKLAGGTDKMSLPMAQHIVRGYERYKTPKRTRFRMWVEFHTLEDWEKAGKLSGEERRRRLLDE